MRRVPLVLGGLAAGVAVFVVGLIVTGGFSVEEEGPPAGDRYCSPEKEDELAALESSSGDTIKARARCTTLLPPAPLS